jgi:hypothetical protein
MRSLLTMARQSVSTLANFGEKAMCSLITMTRQSVGTWVRNMGVNRVSKTV